MSATKILRETVPVSNVMRRATLLVLATLATGVSTNLLALDFSTFKKAYKCLEANGEAIIEGAEKGAKVLEFIATQPLCVAQLVTPPPAIPQIAMGITVTFATQQKLTSYSSCTGQIYGYVANPVMGAVKSGLNQLGSVPPPLDSLKNGLAQLAADNAIELLSSIPGAEVITGGIECGCGLVEAGLKPDTVIQLYNSAKKVVKQCSAFIDDLGPIGKGIVAVGGAAATGWIDVVNDPQHMPVNQYYQKFWLPNVEALSQQLAQPYVGDVWTATVKPVWDNCVTYFDSHDQYRSTAVLTCDGMRDGSRDYVSSGGFQYAVYQRTWDLMTPGVVEYYGRYLSNQQNDMAKAVGLNDAIRVAMSIKLYRDFGLDARGNANRNKSGDVQWAAGSIGAKTISNKHALSGYKAVNNFATRNNILNAVIAKGFNNSPTLEMVKIWQAAYPAIQAAKCFATPVPAGIRKRGTTATSDIRTTSMTCAETGVSDAVQQAGLTACDKISATLKSEINLVCVKPKGEQITDAQVEMLKWHKEKRFAAAGLTCGYDILWNTKAIGCSDPQFTTQCNALLAKEFKGKIDIPKAGVMDCQLKRSPDQKKWGDVMPQVAQVLTPGFKFDFNINAPINAPAASNKQPECTVDAKDPLIARCPGLPGSNSDGYKLAEQLLGKGRVRECTTADRSLSPHWVETPCIIWNRVVDFDDSAGKIGTTVAKVGADSVKTNVAVTAAAGASSTLAKDFKADASKVNLTGTNTAKTGLGVNIGTATTATTGKAPQTTATGNLPDILKGGTVSSVSALGGGNAAKAGATSALTAPVSSTPKVDEAALRNCKAFLGRKDEMLCNDARSFAACKTAVDIGQMKTCRIVGSSDVYSKR